MAIYLGWAIILPTFGCVGTASGDWGFRVCRFLGSRTMFVASMGTLCVGFKAFGVFVQMPCIKPYSKAIYRSAGSEKTGVVANF